MGVTFLAAAAKPVRDRSAMLTNGPILKNLLLFALPVVMGNLFTQFYNLADSIVVGQFVSSDALAAVGASFAIQMVVNSMFAGLGNGASILVSQYIGARDNEKVGRTVATTFTLAIILGAVLTVVGMLAARPMMELIQTPKNIIDDATSYLVIVFAGSIGHLFYNMGNALLRGMGDSKSPFAILVFCTVLNIGLDLLFVIVFHWDVPGVAWATIIAQTVSAALVVWRIARGSYGVKLSRKTLRIDWHLAKKIAGIGVPVALQMMMMSSGMVVIQSFVNGFGSDVMAANTSVMKVDGFVMQPLMGFSQALTTFVGINLGARKLQRVKAGTWRAAVVVIGFALVMAVPLYLWGGYTIRLFTDNETVIRLGGEMLKVMAFFYVFMGLNHCFTGVVRGAGAMTVPMFITLLGMLIRIPLAYWLGTLQNDYLGIQYSMNIANILNALLVFLYYLSGRWKKKSVIDQEIAPVPIPEPAEIAALED